MGYVCEHGVDDNDMQWGGTPPRPLGCPQCILEAQDKPKWYQSSSTKSSSRKSSSRKRSPNYVPNMRRMKSKDLSSWLKAGKGTPKQRKFAYSILKSRQR